MPYDTLTHAHTPGSGGEGEATNVPPGLSLSGGEGAQWDKGEMSLGRGAGGGAEAGVKGHGEHSRDQP